MTQNTPLPFPELLALATMDNAATASESFQAYGELVRRLTAFANSGGLDGVLSLEGPDWGFIEYTLTADNAHTSWAALNDLRRALAILNGKTP
jgi:hypothetical protein